MSSPVPPTSPGAWDAVSAAMAATAVAVPVSPRRIVPLNLMCPPSPGSSREGVDGGDPPGVTAAHGVHGEHGRRVGGLLLLARTGVALVGEDQQPGPVAVEQFDADVGERGVLPRGVLPERRRGAERAGREGAEQHGGRAEHGGEPDAEAGNPARGAHVPGRLVGSLAVGLRIGAGITLGVLRRLVGLGGPRRLGRLGGRFRGRGCARRCVRRGDGGEPATAVDEVSGRRHVGGPLEGLRSGGVQPAVLPTGAWPRALSFHPSEVRVSWPSIRLSLTAGLPSGAVTVTLRATITPALPARSSSSVTAPDRISAVLTVLAASICSTNASLPSTSCLCRSPVVDSSQLSSPCSTFAWSSVFMFCTACSPAASASSRAPA